uniref:Putative secreted peptide n=1 Tax=Anopheles braziliensis TaxID=58242 RepID=A0A2M3ZUI6_9DIPT
MHVCHSRLLCCVVVLFDALLADVSVFCSVLRVACFCVAVSGFYTPSSDAGSSAASRACVARWQQHVCMWEGWWWWW